VEDVQAISDAAAKAIAEHSDLHAVQYRVIDPETGQVVWLEVHAKVVYDEGGNAQRLFGVAQNISENKRVQEEVRVISRMPEENPNPMMRLTPDGSVLYANDPSRVLLDAWKQKTDQTIPYKLKKHLTETFASGRKKEIEITQNGKTFACTLAPIRDTGYVNLYGTDITERKQIAQELARERELLTRLFDAIPVMLTIYEPSTRLLRLNSQFEKTVGWSSQDAAGVSLMEECYPDPEYRAQVGQFMESCTPDEWLDIHMRTRDGRTLETSWSNIRLSSDMQVGIGIDITERKRAENALRVKEAELQEIINRTPFMLTRCSRDLRYRFVSDAYARMIGRTPEEVAGKSLLEIMGEEGLKTVFPYVEKVLEGNQVEYETEVPFEGVGAPSLHIIYTPDRDEHGHVIGWFASITDVTERKRSEHALAEFARQQEALYQLSDRLHHTDSLEDVYNASLDAILKGLQCDRASILLFDDVGVMRFVAWHGLSEAYRRATEGHSPWRPDEENPYPVCIEHIPSSDLSDSINAAIQAEGIGSLAFIPLISNGRLIGKFMIYFNEPHECSDIEIELGLMIGRQLAFGIERIKAEIALRARQDYRWN
jgi:PAS domain S-box-containing protein